MRELLLLSFHFLLAEASQKPPHPIHTSVVCVRSEIELIYFWYSIVGLVLSLLFRLRHCGNGCSTCIRSVEINGWPAVEKAHLRPIVRLRAPPSEPGEAHLPTGSCSVASLALCSWFLLLPLLLILLPLFWLWLVALCFDLRGLLLLPPLCVQARKRKQQDSAAAKIGKAAAVGSTPVFNWMCGAACAHDERCLLSCPHLRAHLRHAFVDNQPHTHRP
jgi:hypothetical protein